MRPVQPLSGLCAAVAVLGSAVGLADGATATTHTLTVKIAGKARGAIHGSAIDCADEDGGAVGPCTVTEPAGTSVTLTAAPGPGSSFAGWSGSGCAGTGACTVTLSSDMTVTATFARPTPSVKSTSLKVTSTSRTASLPVACTGPGTCTGSVQVTHPVKGKTVTLASAKYSVAAGRTGQVKLTFSASTIALLTKSPGKKLKATATLAPVNALVINSALTLKLS